MRFPVWALAVVPVVTACGSDPISAPAGPAVGLRPGAVELDAIGARVQVTATVLDAAGQPVPGAEVTWGSLDTGIAVVDAGLVTARKNGRTTVTARFDTLVGVVDVVVEQVGVAVFKLSGDFQNGIVGEPLSLPLMARVNDRLGHPVQGAAVYFRIVSGGGRLTPPVPRSDGAGIAQTAWTLGPEEGQQVSAASLTPGALTPALFNAIATVR